MSWIKGELGEIFKKTGGFIQTGPFGSQLHVSDYKEIGIPVVMPINIQDGRIIENEIKRISTEKANELSKHFLKKGEIVYSRRGDLSRHAYITNCEEGWLCGTGCLKINIVTGELDIKYFSYFLMQENIRQWIINNAVGTTMLNLNSSILTRLQVEYPPLPEQKAIASILGSLDDKIALNRRMNHTLEETAKALFKSWFVDFDPVAARASGKKPFGMSEELAALFPDSFENSELGEIPKGWNNYKLDQLIEFSKSKKPKNISEEKIENYLPQLLINIFEGEKALFADPEKAIIAGIFDPIMVMDGASSGRIKIGFKGIIGSTLARIVVKKNIDPLIIYLFLKDYEEDIKNNTTGTSIPHADKGRIQRYDIILPENDKILLEFSRIIRPQFELIFKNREEINNLSKTRDILLPRLMSGEILVRDAEKFVRETGI